MKRCPKCPEALQECAAGGVGFFACPGCVAVWMSRDALRELLNDALHVRGETVRVATGAGLTPTPGEMFCPVCPELKLDVIRLRGVEVERCPSCRGILFDPGELQTLEDRTSPSVPLAALGLLVDLLG